MSDDQPIRRTEEPTPSTDPAGVGEPAVVTSEEEVRVAVIPHAPADSADGSGPAHRAEGPVDADPGTPDDREPAIAEHREATDAQPESGTGDEGRAVTADQLGAPSAAQPASPSSRNPEPADTDQPEPEDRIGGPADAVPAETRLDPRPESGGWVTAEPPAVADGNGRPVTVAGPDSAAADSVDRPDPGADIIPDALPPVDARHEHRSREDGADRAAAADRAPADETTDRPALAAVPASGRGDDDRENLPAVAAVPVDSAEETDQHRPEAAATAEKSHEVPDEDRPLSPAEQPTTEAPRIATARAEASRSQEAQAVTDDMRSERTGEPSIHEPRPEETRGASAVSAPAVAPVPPPPAPTTPVRQTGEQPVAAPPAQVPVYLESPLPPKKKGNRGFGILMALLAALVYTLVWAGVAALIIALNTNGDRIAESLTSFLASPAYWGPVVVFALGMIVLSLLVNRGGWAWWLIGGFLVAVAVYFGYLGSAVLTAARQITPDEVAGFVGRIAVSPLAIASAVVAREVSIWFGLATSARGKKVKARNANARKTFDQEQADRRAEYDRARAGIADDKS